MIVNKNEQKAFQLIVRENRIVEVMHFAFAETEEEAKELFHKGEVLTQEEKLLGFTTDILKINQVECKLVEEENEYTKNYPKKEDERTIN